MTQKKQLKKLKKMARKLLEGQMDSVELEPKWRVEAVMEAIRYINRHCVDEK